MTTIFPTTVPSKRLAASISGSASALQLNNILGWNGEALTSSDFGTKLYCILRNDANTLMEIMELDPSTIASASITILRRGLKFTGDLTTEVSANKLTWIKNETIVELGTDVPQLLKSFVDIYSAQTIEGIKTFSSSPVVPTPVGSTDAANKAYVDLVAGGIATTINVIVPGTAGETITAGMLIYFDDTENEWMKCDADTAATVDNTLLGIAQGSGTNGNAITGGVLLRGLDSNQSGLTAAAIYYASNTAGGISASAGTVEVTVGFSYSTTQLYFNPRFNQQLTEDQQDALTGKSGTAPSLSNKFIDDADTATAATANKIARRLATGDITVPSSPTNQTDAISKGYAESIFATIASFLLTAGIGVATTVKTYWIFSKPFIFSTDVPTTNFWTTTNCSVISGVNYAQITPSSDATTMLQTTVGVFAIAGAGSAYPILFSTAKKKYVEFGLSVRAVGAEQHGWGFSRIGTSSYFIDYDDQVRDGAGFSVDAAGALYAHTAREGVGHTETLITGVTLTALNTYRIEIDSDALVRFYVNGVLKATHTTNCPNGAFAIGFGFGSEGNSSNNGEIICTEPNFAIEK